MYLESSWTDLQPILYLGTVNSAPVSSNHNFPLIKIMNAIFDIDSFEQQCVIIMGLLQYEWL